MPSIVIYFSRAGENYVNGEIKKLKTGNTQLAAEILSKATGSDLFRVEPLIKYSEDYSQCVEEAQSDLQRNARPELEAYPKNLEGYGIIYLAYPNYCGTLPMPMFTLLEKLDCTGKIIYPLCTHEGSRMGRSEQDIKRLCPYSEVKKGLPVHGAEVFQAAEQIIKWART